ncbi:MAG: hypothetical protein WC520_02595 [Candidatus Paceibacterota bacterium]
MNKTKKIVLIVVVILILAGVAGFAFCNYSKKGNEIRDYYYAWLNKTKASLVSIYENYPYQTLKELKLQSGINFSETKRTKFVWQSLSEGILPVTITGYTFDKTIITNDQSDKIREMFEQGGFALQFFDVDINSFAGISGYRKDDTVCMIKSGPTKDANNELVAEDKLNFEIYCGRLAAN